MIEIKDKVSTDLALRHVADSFFNELEQIPGHEIAISFFGIHSISRSFAHQYMVRKRKSPKSIKEFNMPVNVEKMFNLVNNTSNKKEAILDLSTMQVVTV